MAETKAEEGTFASDLRALLESGDGADVTLVAGDCELAAHSLILAARSPVFAAMLRSDMREATSRRVQITDVQEGVLRQMLCFVYTDTAPELESVVAELLAAADKYNLPLLKKRCELQMQRDLSVEDAAATATLAVLHRCPGLKSAAVQFIAGHPEVLATEGWAKLLRDNAEAAVELCRELAAAAKERTVSNDDTQNLAQRLTEAAEAGKVQEVQDLLAAGAPVDGRNHRGSTALHLAVLGKHVESVKCLLDAGANVNIEDSSMQTPLHCAAVEFDLKIMCMLITASANVDAKDRWSKTPLHWAAETSPQAVRALLLAGASRRQYNMSGQWPEDVAISSTKPLFSN